MTPLRREPLPAISSSRGEENAPSGARSSKSSNVTPYDAVAMLVSPVAACRFRTVVCRMPPAQKPSVSMSGEPVTSLTTSTARSISLA